MSGDLDKIDQRILKELAANGRLSIVELATRVNLTNTPCSERVKRLERSGYISGYRAVLNMEKMGLGHLTIVQVSLAATAISLLSADWELCLGSRLGDARNWHHCSQLDSTLKTCVS